MDGEISVLCCLFVLNKEVKITFLMSMLCGYVFFVMYIMYFVVVQKKKNVSENILYVKKESELRPTLSGYSLYCILRGNYY